MTDPVLAVRPLGFVWETYDPFLFCVHHDDDYPAGDDRFAPKASLAGRNMGSDFEGIDGWRMYHGRTVPGFPQHPHRGFETVTIARRGYIDHSDSLGAAARFGQGDVQWLTAGAGIVHSEMFPLLKGDDRNPVELFQIWLNLPKVDKLAPPHFSMLWADEIPVRNFTDEAGKRVEVHVIAGLFDAAKPPAPPPHSWASRPESEVAIRTYKLEAGAKVTIEAATAGLNRTLYLFKGKNVRIGTRTLSPKVGVRLRSDLPVEVQAGPEETELLLLQARPIGEPVAQHGPFVMNTTTEIQQAFSDYRRTLFGGWPWPADGPVHGREGRFARHADGRLEVRGPTR